MRISDWSSDVCSSDLKSLRTSEVSVGAIVASSASSFIFWTAAGALWTAAGADSEPATGIADAPAGVSTRAWAVSAADHETARAPPMRGIAKMAGKQIGRASGREGGGYNG